MKPPTVRTSASIADAIDAIQSDIDRTVIVLDQNEHVVGILTEGDAVRAFRRGVLPEATITSILTGRVRVATEAFGKWELAQRFVEDGTLLIPLVDGNRKLIGVQRSREAVSEILALR